MLRSSIVIATYNRPVELGRALRSLLVQTRLPDEVIVVDDGDLPRFPLQEMFRAAGILTVFLRKERPGLTASRNAGMRAASGDVILFIDDDVVLLPDYVREIVAVFEGDRQSAIGGVGGLEANLLRHLTWRSRIRRLVEIAFGMAGFREGRVLPSGYCTEYGSTGRPIRKITAVDFLVGATSAYRAAICRAYAFSEDYNATSHGIGEDKAFSYSVSRQYRVVVNPDALLYHYESPVSRASYRERGRSTVLHHYRFFKRQVLRHGYQWPLFYYALFGHLLSRSLVALLLPGEERKAKVAGMWSAAWEVLRGRLDRGGRLDREGK